MKVKVVAVGRLRNPAFAQLCRDYSERVGRFGAFDLIEVKDARGTDPKRAIVEEGDRLLRQLPPGAVCVGLDERGKQMTSSELSRWLDDQIQGGTRDLRFVIGGPYGLSPAVRKRCTQTLRLSSMTLPHELARVVLLEQLYRAWSILRGLPYHHA